MSSTLKRYRCADGAPSRVARKELASLLESGQVVALPTETVCGLAARADRPEALERLRALKSRDPKLPLTWHVGSRDVLASGAELPNTVGRLANRYWPGPLTLVVRPMSSAQAPLARDGWVGVRFPAHTTTAELLESLPFPVAMTSANRSGGAPLHDADAVAETFGDELVYLVDDGPTCLQEASAVLRVGRGSFELLREGLLSFEELCRIAGLRVGFVCTGNTCRSPMADPRPRHSRRAAGMRRDTARRLRLLRRVDGRLRRRRSPRVRACGRRDGEPRPQPLPPMDRARRRWSASSSSISCSA